jgi:hypothetical protein
VGCGLTITACGVYDASNAAESDGSGGTGSVDRTRRWGRVATHGDRWRWGSRRWGGWKWRLGGTRGARRVFGQRCWQRLEDRASHHVSTFEGGFQRQHRGPRHEPVCRASRRDSNQRHSGHLYRWIRHLPRGGAPSDERQQDRRDGRGRKCVGRHSRSRSQPTITNRTQQRHEHRGEACSQESCGMYVASSVDSSAPSWDCRYRYLGRCSNIHNCFRPVPRR